MKVICCFLLFLVISSCMFVKEEEQRFIVTPDMVGGLTTNDMKEFFKCNYILDFDENGYQIWKINYDDIQLFLFFNSRNILENYKYVGDSVEPTHKVVDDLPYYIPKDAYLSKEELHKMLGDNAGDGAKDGVDQPVEIIDPEASEKKFLKMLDKLLDE